MKRIKFMPLISFLILALAMTACQSASTETVETEAAHPQEPAMEESTTTETEAEQAAAAEASDEEIEALPEGFDPSSLECIAPAYSGGGWDYTCRANTAVLNELGLTSRILVTNMAGDGGGLAFSSVVSERNDDDNLLVAASPATTLRLAQNEYEGYTEDDVRWVAATGGDFGLLAVDKNSDLKSFEDLVATLQADPSALKFGGGSSFGGQDHMKVLLLAKEIGVDPLAINYISYEGGGEAMTALLSGFIDVFPGDASESLGQFDAGEVRVLATLTEERLPGSYADTPAAKELGYEVTWIIFRGFWAPGNMSDEAYNYWVNTLEQMADTPEWVQSSTQGGLQPFYIGGAEFESLVKNQVADFRQLSIDLGLIVEE